MLSISDDGRILLLHIGCMVLHLHHVMLAYSGRTLSLALCECCICVITPTVVGVYRVLSIKPVHLKFAIFTFTMEAI